MAGLSRNFIASCTVSLFVSSRKRPNRECAFYGKGRSLGWKLVIFCCSDIQRPMRGTETNEADKAENKLLRLLTARLQGESSEPPLVWEKDFSSDGRKGG